MVETREIEIWKDIPGYVPYKVSNLGRVMGPIKILKPSFRKNGYVYMNLTIDKKNKSKCLHRLVMLAFIGPSKLDVDHINSDKSDNRLCNLRYVSSRENNISKEKTKGYHRCHSTGRWKSEIRIDGKRIWLGRFDTEQEAKAAYMTAYNNAINKNSKGEYI